MADLQDLNFRRDNSLQRVNTGDKTSPEAQAAMDLSAAARSGEFSNGVRRALTNASQTADAFIGGMAEPYAPDFAARQFAKAEVTQQTAPRGFEQKVQSFRDINSVGDAASYGAGALGEGVASVATMAAAGLAARLGAGGLLRLGATGKNIAQYGGGVAAMLPQEAGETALTLRNNPEAMANTTPEERRNLMLGKGIAASAMENIVPQAVFAKTIGGAANRIAAGAAPALGNIARKGAAGAVGEFATEGAQELSGQVAENIATGESGYDFERALEAGVRGAITGGVLGGAGGTVQAARSNIDAAAETALEKAKPTATSAMNMAVEKLDNFVRNPEQMGADAANTTMGALAEASARARDVGGEVADAAGPAAASSMEAIAGIRAKFDAAVAGQLTPENIKKYTDLTTRFRMLQASEYEVLRDAFDTGDAAQINNAVGVVSAKLAARVPRETMAGIKGFATWAKKFGKGVTNAAREGRKAAQKYSKEDVQAFAQYLDENQSAVANTLINSQENPEQVLRSLMAARYSKLSPKDLGVLQKALAPIGSDVSSFLKDIRAADTTVIGRPRQTTRVLSEKEERETYGGTSAENRIGDRAENLLLGDALVAQAARDGVELGEFSDSDNAGYTSSVPEGERGTLGDALNDAIIRDDDGKEMNVEDTRRTPYNSLAQVRRILGADMLTKEDGTPIVDRKTGESKVNKDAGFTLPSTLSIAEVKDGEGNVTQPALPPKFIGQLLRGKESRSQGYENGKSLGFKSLPMGIDEATVASRTTEDGKGYVQEFNSIDMAAQAGTPQASGGSKENFAGFVEDFDGTNKDLNIQGWRLLGAISSMHNDGIDIPRSEIKPSLLEAYGLNVDGPDIHIDVQMPPGSLNENTIVQKGKKNSTIGDLTGLTRARRALPKQLELLERLAYPDNVSVAAELKKADDQTSDAALVGLESFAVRNERAAAKPLRFYTPKGFAHDALLNKHVDGYMADLQERIGNSELKARSRADAGTLYGALSDGVITPTLVRDAVEVLEDDTIEDENGAVDQLRIDLELEAQTDKELVNTLMAFRDGTMRQWEIHQEAFGQEPISEDTVDKEFDAFNKAGGRTPMRNIDQQSDAWVRANTPMTVAHQTKMLESLPKALQDKFWRTESATDEAGNPLEQQRREQPADESAEEQLELPFDDGPVDYVSSFGSVKFLNIEHAHVSYGKPDTAKGKYGSFNQKAYDNYLKEVGVSQAELAKLIEELPNNKYRLGQLADRKAERELKASLAAQDKGLGPRGKRTPDATYPIVPAGKVKNVRAGRSRELTNALKAATTPAEVIAARDAAAKDVTDPETLEGINSLARARWDALGGPAKRTSLPEGALDDEQLELDTPLLDWLKARKAPAEPAPAADQQLADEQISVEQLKSLVRDELFTINEGNMALEGKDGDENRTRQQSMNPQWFKENPDMTSVKYVREAVAKYAKGKVKLGKKQQRVIDALKAQLEQEQADDAQQAADLVRGGFDAKGRQKNDPEYFTDPAPVKTARPARTIDEVVEETPLQKVQRIQAERKLKSSVVTKQRAQAKPKPKQETNAENTRRLVAEQKKPEQTKQTKQTKQGPTAARRKPADTANARKIKALREGTSEPPQEPPTGKPPQEPTQPPPPPPDNEARAKFIATVKRLLGNRVRVEFDATDLGDGVAGEYISKYGVPLEDNAAALKKVRESLRTDKAALKMDPEDRKKVDDPRTDAQIQRAIDKGVAEEQRYLDDLAVRGTIRVAVGMEAQAGLAEHEALHAAFEVFFGADNAADRKAITTAFTRGVLANNLQKYFAGNEEVLAVIDPTSPTFRAEEAAAYAFQVFLHDPGALQMGAKVEGIFNKFLAYLQKLVGYKTYEQKAQMVFNDLNSGRRSERGISVLRDNPNVEKAMLAKSQDFVRAVGTGFMHMYDTVLSSTYDRMESSGNVAMAQIARLGYNETGQRGEGMLQLSRLAVTQWSNRLKEALHTLNADELDQLNQAMLLEEELTGKLAEPQKRLRSILKDVHKYQTDAGIEMGDLGDTYFPMIWNPDKVAAEPKENFIAMLQQEKYAEAMAKSMQTPDEIYEAIASFESRGHEFQGVFNKDGEPVADSSNRRSLGFIEKEDRAKYMEDDLVTTMGHYLNQSVRHAEYVRAYGKNGSKLKELMGEITGTYGGTGGDLKLAQDYIDGLLGNKEVGMSRELKDLYGAATVYQNVRLLPLSVFSSLVDPLGIAVRTQSMGGVFDTLGYSIRNMFTDFRNKQDWTPDMWEQYADDMGTIDMSGTIKSIDKIYTGVTLRGKTQEINDGFFKWNLLNGWVKNNHIGATKAAQLYLRRNAEGEMFTGKMRDENLAEAGVSAEDIVYDETLGRIKSTAPEILGYVDKAEMELKATEDEIQGAREQADRIQKAIHKIVRQSMIQPSSAEMPGWMSNPYLAPISHLKTFVFGFNATILQRLAYEAKRGNYNPIYYAAAYVPGMIAADFIKGFAGNGGEEPEWKKNWGVSDYLGYGVERSGLLGTGQFFADMNNDVTRGGGGFESLAGPSIEQATDLMGAMNAKTSQPTATWMTNALPANALYDQWLRDN